MVDHLEVINLLLRSGSDVNAKEIKFGDSPLHLAAKNGNVDVIDLLIGFSTDSASSNNASNVSNHFVPINAIDLNIRKKTGWTPVHVAANSGHVAALERLLDAGANINAGDKDLDTPLHATISDHVVEVVRIDRRTSRETDR